MSGGTATREIAIVDDDDAVRDSMRAVLESLGFAVHDYRSAVDFLARRNADSAESCLLLDLHMPVMTGLDLLEFMQANGPRIPTIVITGRGNSDLRDKALRSGAVALIDKPVTGNALLGALDSAFAAAA
ncbi:MAG TPA: response regulator [Micropepsaceae bacterium]|nr:response regulator [Micropepsaceae bacterium]